MEVLNAIAKNNNFYVFENMLCSSTGHEICYIGEGHSDDDEYSFYKTGCRYTYTTENEKYIAYYINSGERIASYKETRKEFFDKTVLLPLKNGVFLNFIDENNETTYAYKSIHGKKFVSKNLNEIFDFISNYDNACEQVFEQEK